MFISLFNIFLDVVVPVFALVLIGYLSASRLELQAKTLNRSCYYIFVPAFIFNIISTAKVELTEAIAMIVSISIVHILLAFVAFMIAKMLGRSREVIAAFVLIAVFGNVGNFGLSLIGFRFGETALVAGSVYFLVVMLLSFVICVGISGWARGGSIQGIASVLKTPALLALIPSIAFNYGDITLPLFASRAVGLLADATIPTMLFTLGVQLTVVTRFKLTYDILIASSIKLIVGPLLAFVVVQLFHLEGINAGANIIQSAMPTAILSTIIAGEFNIKPEFVTTAVLFATLFSLITLTLVLTFV